MTATMVEEVVIEGRSSGRLAPATQMREMLAVSKRQDVPFDRAWRSAYAHIRWPHDTLHRQQWKDELEGTRDHWRRAYENEGQPTRALVALYGLLVECEGERPRQAA